MNTHDAKSSLDNSKKEAEEAYYNVKESLEETGKKIKDKTQVLLEEGKEQFASLEQSVMEYEEAFINKVKERPITSLLLAAGTGFLLSYLLKEKEKNKN